MGYRSGRVSYARFGVTGGPEAVTSDLLEVLASGQIRIAAAGTPSETEAGWVAGRHVLDADFRDEVVVFGDVLLFGLRLDTNRVPAEIRQAYRALAEDARRKDSSTGAVSGAERREARQEADDRCREELAAGKYRRSTLVPVLWDVRRRIVLAPAASEGKRTALADMFNESFDAGLEPRSAGSMAYELLSARGRTRDYEDLSPSPFTGPPPGAAEENEGRDVETPVVPWSTLGPEPKDFLGNEFLMWLWSQAVRGEAVIDTRQGSVGLVIDRLLESECAWAVTGKQTLRADAPLRWPESIKGFENGKWARKAGLTLASGGEHWELTFQADRFSVSSAKLPNPDEPPASERELVEMRVASVLALDDALTGMFETFIEHRLADGWGNERHALADAIRRRRPAEPASPAPTKAVAEVEIVTRPVEVPTPATVETATEGETVPAVEA